MNVAFIIGSPRSGTTILENILNCHPKISEWYEPYYLWGSYFPDKGDDIWSDCYLTENCKKLIQQEYANFARKSHKSIVLDKSHQYVFNIKIVQKIFPKAKWIHILRDGRDVTLSIHKEWIKRKNMIQHKDFLKLFRVTWNMLKRQPFWRYRLMAVIYELRTNSSLRPSRYLNKSKWNGNIGWGLRFENWQKYLETHSTLQFNALQWVKSVEAVRQNWSLLQDDSKVEIRYEDLLKAPGETLNNVLEVLGVDSTTEFFNSIPKLEKNNFNKWANAFSEEELNEIKPILSSLISELGYANSSSW
jgi:hypothetical protein